MRDLRRFLALNTKHLEQFLVFQKSTKRPSPRGRALGTFPNLIFDEQKAPPPFWGRLGGGFSLAQGLTHA